MPEGAPKPLSIPAGRFAALLYKGPYAELEQAYDWLFGHWLPESGYDAAHFPIFEEYLNDPRVTPPNELLTRIHCMLAD
jgi:AraC family transcriptional regulator